MSIRLLLPPAPAKSRLLSKPPTLPGLRGAAAGGGRREGGRRAAASGGHCAAPGHHSHWGLRWTAGHASCDGPDPAAAAARSSPLRPDHARTWAAARRGGGAPAVLIPLRAMVVPLVCTPGISPACFFFAVRGAGRGGCGGQRRGGAVVGGEAAAPRRRCRRWGRCCWRPGATGGPRSGKALVGALGGGSCVGSASIGSNQSPAAATVGGGGWVAAAAAGGRQRHHHRYQCLACCQVHP